MTTELVIEAEGLRKAYDGAEAVAGLDFGVPRGALYGFLGRNGSGKTTTIKMLLGMTRPDGGSGKVFGRRADAPAESVEIRRRTGYVSEDKGLYDYMTVARMLDFTRPFFPKWRAEVEERLLRLFDLPPRRKVRALSKGMRTKLALLLALARGADLLVLDEPTEGLDPAMAEEALAAITGLAAEQDGLTVFFSSHQIAEVEQIADRVLIINHGRAVVEGAPDELKENYRRVQVVFGGEGAPAGVSFAAPGVASVKRDGRWLSLFVSGDAERVAQEARSAGAVSVDVRPVTLKEIFLESVKEEKDEG